MREGERPWIESEPLPYRGGRAGAPRNVAEVRGRKACALLQLIAAYCSLLQLIAAYCSLLQLIAAYCSLLQLIAAYCSLLQLVAPIAA
jgi:hypothetical protein